MDARELEHLNSQHRREEFVRDRDRAHDARRELAKQRDDAAIQTGQAAARMVILINGGAIAGMLAFIGNIAPKCQSWAKLTDPLVWFVVGIVAGVLTLGLGWMRNYSSGAEIASIRELPGPPFKEETDASRRYRKVGGVSGVASVVFWIVGLGAFSVGCFLVYLAVNNIGPCSN